MKFKEHQEQRQQREFAESLPVSPESQDREVASMWDVAAERAFLACLMKRPTLLMDASKRITEDMIYLDEHRYLYKVFLFAYKAQVENGWAITLDPDSLLWCARHCSEDVARRFVGNAGFKKAQDIYHHASTIDLGTYESWVARVRDAAARIEAYRGAREIQLAALNKAANPTSADILMRGQIEFASLAMDFAGDRRNKVDNLGVQNEGFMAKLELSRAYPNAQIFGVRCEQFPYLMSLNSDNLSRGSLTTIVARPKTGKAQDVDSPILTPEGWVRMGDITVGDMVAGSDGNFYPVTGVFPQGRKKIYRVIFGDGVEVRCCDEHLWFTRTRSERRQGYSGQVRSLAEIRDTLRCRTACQRANHDLPYVEPIRFPERDLPLDPYLLGVMLGDGRCCGAVCFWNPEADVVDRVERLLPDGDTLTRHNGLKVSIKRVVRSTKPSGVMAAMTEMGLTEMGTHQKFVPHQYLVSSVDQRLSLLRGLVDTDGYVTGRRGQSIEYVTTSPRLRDDVIHLVQSLGGRATFLETTGQYRDQDGDIVICRTAWRIYITFYNGVIPCSSDKHLAKYNEPVRDRRRTIVNVVEAGEAECQCISVAAPDSLYVTSGFVPTHNTSILVNMGLSVASQGVPVLLLDNEMTRDEMHTRSLAQISGESEKTIISGRMLDDDFDEDRRQRVFAALNHLKDLKFYYANVATLSPSQVVAIMRQFRHEIVGSQIMPHPRTGIDMEFANPALVLFDWLKIPITDGTTAEWQSLGHLVSQIKDASASLNLPTVAGAQANRTAAGSTAEDYENNPDAFVGGSDRLNMFSSSVLHLRDITPDEREQLLFYMPVDQSKHEAFLNSIPSDELRSLVSDLGLGPMVRVDALQKQVDRIRVNGYHTVTANDIDLTDRSLTRFNQLLHVRYNRNGDTFMPGIPLFHDFGKFRYTEMMGDPVVRDYRMEMKRKKQEKRREPKGHGKRGPRSQSAIGEEQAIAVSQPARSTMPDDESQVPR